MGVKDIQIQGGNSLPIKQFKLEYIVENPSIVMIAKRASGKSWVTKAILMHFSKIPCGIVISPTDRMSEFYNKFFPDTYIHYSYKSELIAKILSRQKQIIDKKNSGKNVDPRSFIIMDDCLGDKKSWVRDPPILELLFNGRHYQLMYILTMQFALGITPELRSNFDYIFLLTAEFQSEKKKLFDHYAGMFHNFDSFRQVFEELTSDFGCMVIDNRKKVSNSFERLYWYKAPDLTNKFISFGCKQFRKYHERNYDKNWRKKISFCNPNDMMNNLKKTKGILKVEKEEVDENGNIIDKKKQSTQNYYNKHNQYNQYNNQNNNQNNQNNNYSHYNNSYGMSTKF
jgi:hypothetical protein